jgi:hypothetical protein
VTITAPHPGLPSGALLVGDERLDEASGGWYDHVNPTTGLVQKRIPIAGTSEVDLAVGVAQRAFPGPVADRVPDHGGRVLVGFGSCFRAGSLGPNEQAANLVCPMIIKYRKGRLRGDSPGASSHTIVGVHGKWRFEMRVHGVCEPPGLIDRRSGGIDDRKQPLRPILQGA